MFGFVVKNIDIPNNSIKLSKINKDKFGTISQGDLISIKTDVDEGLHEYISDYTFSPSGCYRSKGKERGIYLVIKELEGKG